MHVWYFSNQTFDLGVYLEGVVLLGGSDTSQALEVDRRSKQYVQLRC